MKMKWNEQFVFKPGVSTLLLGVLVLFSFLSSCNPMYNLIACGDSAALIDAIKTANNTPSTYDVIDLDANCIYELKEISDNQYYGDSGLPVIVSPIRINGNGAEITRRRETDTEKFRIITVGINGELELYDLTISNGYANDPQYPNDVERNSGGAIFNAFQLMIDGVTIEYNYANGVTGGIFNNGTLEILNSTIQGNDQDGNVWTMGGASAIHNRFGNGVSISNSIINHNGPSGHFYAITNDETSMMTIVNSTLSGNSGFAINNDGDLDLRFVSIIGNGHGITSVAYGIPKVSMLAVLLQNGSDCTFGQGVLVTSLFNMDSDGSCDADFTVAPGDMGIGPLVYNGGQTRTHALLPGSPAIDAVNQALVPIFTHLFEECPVDEDQRGVSRPQGNFCDIGAFEYEGVIQPPAATLEPTATFTTTPTPTPTLTPTATPQAYSRCDLFDGENASLTMFDIPYGTTDLSLYVLWPHPVWGLEEAVEGDQDPWEYAATLGSTSAEECTYQGYTGRLYCDFELPEAALGASLPLNVYINLCDDPIFTHPTVSVFEPVLTCSETVTKEQCGDFGGTYNMTAKICHCP